MSVYCILLAIRMLFGNEYIKSYFRPGTSMHCILRLNVQVNVKCLQTIFFFSSDFHKSEKLIKKI